MYASNCIQLPVRYNPKNSIYNNAEYIAPSTHKYSGISLMCLFLAFRHNHNWIRYDTINKPIAKPIYISSAPFLCIKNDYLFFLNESLIASIINPYPAIEITLRMCHK